MRNFFLAVISILICASYAQAEELKLLIPANSDGKLSGIGIAFGEVDPITQGVCKKQVCKYNVTNGTTVSLWRAVTSQHLIFDYWIQDGEQDSSQLLQFQMSADTTVLLKESKIVTETPVIIVPGIFGSWSREMFCGNEDAVNDIMQGLEIAVELKKVENSNVPIEWTVDPITGTYDALYKSFEQEGLRPTLFGYDWRQDIQHIAVGDPDNHESPSLIQIIDQVKEKYNVDQVDIVAHSMGGLIVREYIQNHYRGDIRKFAMIGTPNQGSLDVYRIWEAGHFARIDGTMPPWIMEIILENMKEGCENSFMNDAKFVRKWIPSVKQLLPTFDYFIYPSGVIESEYYLQNFEQMCHYNDYLINLNAGAWSLVDSGVDMHIFASGNKRTLQEFQSNNEHSQDNCNRVKWADERPVEKYFADPNIGPAGDGRVLFSQSAYPAQDMPIFESIPVSVVSGQHGSLPSKLSVINGVINFLMGEVDEPELN